MIAVRQTDPLIEKPAFNDLPDFKILIDFQQKYNLNLEKSLNEKETQINEFNLKLNQLQEQK